MPSRVGRVAFGALVVFSVLAMGSMETLPLVVCGLAAAAAAVAASWEAESAAPRRGATIVVMVGLGLAAWTGLQAVPLPAGLVGALSPHAGDVWSRALLPLGEAGPRWHSLSLEPTATRVELLKGLVYLAAFAAALQIGRRSTGVRFIERLLMATGMLVAVVAFVHEAVGATKVYGFYEPRTDVTRISPLMNANHLAAYLNIALQIGFANVVIGDRRHVRLAVALTVVLGLTAAEIWLGSRGAVAAMVFGFIGTVVLARSDERRRTVGAGVVVPVLAAVVGMSLVALGLSESAAREIGDTDVSKLGVAWRAFRAFASNYPIFGAGRGAFETTYPEFRTEMGYLVFTHPENVLVQWTSEWGIPIAVCSMVALVVALRPSAALRRSTPSVGAWSAVAVVALQNLVDFSLESPGVVLALVGCAALIVGGRGDESRPVRVDAILREPRRLSLALAAAVVVTSAFALFGLRHELQTDYDRTSTALKHKPAELDRNQLHVSMEAHPAAAFFSYAGAVAEAAAGGEQVPVWAGHAIERSPVYGPAHLVLARWLRRRSPAQSRLEYRIAQEQGAGQIPDVELVSMVSGYEDAVAIAPAGRRGVELLNRLAAAFDRSLPSTAVRIDAEILQRDPNAVDARLREARRALRDAGAREDAPWCEREDCLADARKLADAAVAVDAGHCAPYVVRARVDLVAGDAVLAVRTLRDAMDRVTDGLTCAHELAALAIDAHSETDATQAIDRMTRMPCDGTGECIGVLMDAADLESRRGNTTRAVVHLRRAAQAAPDRDDVVEALAAAAARAGLHAEARANYAILVSRHPGDGRLAALLTAEEAATTQ